MPAKVPVPPAVERFLWILHLAGCLVLMLAMFWIVADVSLRGLIGQTVPDTHELVAYVVPVAVFLQIPYVLARDEHLLSPLVVDRSRPRVRRHLLILRDAAGLAFSMTAAWASYPAAVAVTGTGRTYAHTRVLPLSVALARWVVVIGLVIMALIFAWRLLQRFRPVPEAEI